MSTFLYGANVRANGIRQHYLRYGGDAGPRGARDALIIIPGITSPALTWGFVGERFGRHFDTYILDVRGRGLSASGATLDYSVDAQAADVIALADALGLERYALVGHSMGARIAARAAGSRPTGLARVVMADPPVSGPGRRAYPARLPWYVDSMRDARAGIGIEGMRAGQGTGHADDRRARRRGAAGRHRRVAQPAARPADEFRRQCRAHDPVG
jgi:N-formylmaleamate deformylase